MPSGYYARAGSIVQCVDDRGTQLTLGRDYLVCQVEHTNPSYNSRLLVNGRWCSSSRFIVVETPTLSLSWHASLGTPAEAPLKKKKYEGMRLELLGG